MLLPASLILAYQNHCGRADKLSTWLKNRCHEVLWPEPTRFYSAGAVCGWVIKIGFSFQTWNSATRSADSIRRFIFLKHRQQELLIRLSGCLAHLAKISSLCVCTAWVAVTALAITWCFFPRHSFWPIRIIVEGRTNFRRDFFSFHFVDHKTFEYRDDFTVIAISFFLFRQHWRTTLWGYHGRRNKGPGLITVRSYLRAGL